MKLLSKLKPKSFQQWLIYGVSFILTVLILVLISITTKKYIDFFEEQALNQASNRSNAIAASCKVWLLANDYSGLSEAIHNFTFYDDIVFIAVIDLDGKVLAHTDSSFVGKYIADENRVSYLKRVRSKSISEDIDEKIFLRNDKFIDIAQVVHQGKSHIGMVEIRIDQSRLNHNIRRTFLESSVFTVLAIVVAWVFAYFISNQLVLRLLTLASVMKNVREGNRNITANENELKEIADLALEFNLMLRALNESEASVQKSKERLELAFEGSGDGLWDWNIKEDILYFSPTWKKMIGYEDSEISNLFSNWEKNVHPDDLTQALKDIEDHLEGKTPLYRNVHRLRHKEGYWVWNLARGKALYDKNGTAVRMVGTHTDISNQKKLEQELKDQEELIIAQSRHVAMGEMIGMIAHQWRQPITVIAMDANNMLLDIELDEVNLDKFKSEANSILHQTQYLSKTIDDFRNFFRPNKEKEIIKLSDIFKEAQMIMGKSLESSMITLNMNIKEDIVVQTYTRELMQVVINILKNAKEALLENKHDDRTINVDIFRKQEKAIIMICDNGGGIPDEIMSHIFEPYFSTKDQQTGTGLGLHMSKTIIEKHLHGMIIATNVGQGACFELNIPIGIENE